MARPIDLGGGRWRVRVFVGREPVLGKQITRTFTFEAAGIRAARVRAGELERQARASDGAKETFGEAVEKWWAHWSTSKNRALRTRQGYRQRIDHDLKPTKLWSTRVDKIGPDDIDRWYRHMHDAGAAPASVRKVHTIVRQTFTDLVRRRVLAASPALQPWLPQAAAKETRIPTLPELDAILRAADRRDLTRSACFLLAAGTAMRRGELAALRWSKVDLEAQRVLIDTASVLGGQLKGTKTGKRGVKALQPIVVAGLQVLRRHQEALLAEGRVPWPAESDWCVFATLPPYTKAPHEDTFSDWFAQARADAGVTVEPLPTLHSLRHWAVSNALAAGVAPTDVQAMSGHASLSLMLDVYGHAVGEASERAGASLPLPQFELGRGEA